LSQSSSQPSSVDELVVVVEMVLVAVEVVHGRVVDDTCLYVLLCDMVEDGTVVKAFVVVVKELVSELTVVALVLAVAVVAVLAVVVVAVVVLVLVVAVVVLAAVVVDMVVVGFVVVGVVEVTAVVVGTVVVTAVVVTALDELVVGCGDVELVGWKQVVGRVPSSSKAFLNFSSSPSKP
jgi:hypothetical protein